jgi:hypothetical protein
MANIIVKKLNETTFEVKVEANSTTTHVVTVQPDYASKLTGGNAPTEQLVSRSFDFLLERESNTSILRSFDLPVISRYFPEYERTIQSLLG